MKPRIIRNSLIVCAALVSLACTANDATPTLIATVEPPADATAQKYFDTITAIFQERDSAHIALDREVRPPGAASEVGEAKRWFDLTIEIIASQIAALSTVEDLPLDVEVAHGKYLATTKALLEFNRRIARRLGEADQDTNLAQIVGDPELGVEAQRLLVDEAAEACTALQNAAVANRIVEDLRCGAR